MTEKQYRSKAGAAWIALAIAIVLFVVSVAYWSSHA